MRDMMTTIDMTTGKLDRCISEMKVWAKRAEAGYLDEADVQTIKHHAEDMKAMGDYVLRKIDPPEINIKKMTWPHGSEI